jgi:hypothetical protein
MSVSEDFRAAAAETLDMAGKTVDPHIRVALLLIAQKWLKLARRYQRQDAPEADAAG